MLPVLPIFSCRLACVAADSVSVYTRSAQCALPRRRRLCTKSQAYLCPADVTVKGLTYKAEFLHVNAPTIVGTL
jgi:hypothetical protein